MDIAARANLLYETAEQHDPYEKSHALGPLHYLRLWWPGGLRLEPDG